jgi:hypothetical protein
MLAEYLKSIWLIVPITLVTIGLEAAAMTRMPKTAGSSLPGTLAGFLIFGLGFGFLAILAYLLLAVGCAVLLTLFGFVARPLIHAPWVVAVLWTLMNFLWGLGYGWFLPRILSLFPGS